MSKINEILSSVDVEVDENGVFMKSTMATLNDNQKKLYKFIDNSFTNPSDILQVVYVWIKNYESDPDNDLKGISMDLGKLMVRFLKKWNLIN